MRTLSAQQALIGALVIVAATGAAMTGVISGDALIVLYSTIIGYAFGIVNGRQSTDHAVAMEAMRTRERVAQLEVDEPLDVETNGDTDEIKRGSQK